jgi:uncharacterized protein YabN with tetrapyrrole methylase and pyrophosphatase domain
MEHLQKLVTLEKEASEFGFEWPHYDMILDQVRDECREVKEAIVAGESPDRIQEEIGDLLHAVFSLCIFLGFDTEETLTKTNHKFESRMKALKEVVYEHGLKDLRGQPIDFMLQLWQEAKVKI